MARRLIHTTRVGANCAVKIYRDSEYNEYLVRSVIHGRVEGGREDGGSFEMDRRDARGTAAA